MKNSGIYLGVTYVETQSDKMPFETDIVFSDIALRLVTDERNVCFCLKNNM